jgi:hypothetical protein
VLVPVLAWLAAAVIEEPASTHAVTDALEVGAGTTCLDEARVVEHVVRWLERDRIDARQRLEVRAEVDRVVLVVRTEGAVVVERSLSPLPADCADLHAAVGLALALAVDASVLESLGVAAPPDPPRAPAEDSERAPEPTPPPIEDAPPRRGPLVGIELAATTMVGVPRGVAFGAAITGQLGVASWLDVEVGLVATGGLPVAVAPSTAYAGEVVPVLTFARAGVCPRRDLGPRVALRGCAGLDAGGLLAFGRAFDETRLARLPWLAARTGIDLDVAVAPRAALRFGLDAIVPVIRTEWAVRDGSGAVLGREDAASLGGALTIGVVLGERRVVKARARRPGRRGSARSRGMR